jgi:predicted metalloprotease with PDZ domain
MRSRISLALGPFILLCFVGLPSRTVAQGLEPITYSVRLSEAAKNLAEVEAIVPTGGRDRVELMMPVWSPGYYGVQNYAANVQGFAARTPDGKALTVERPQKNRWKVLDCAGEKKVVVSYKLTCKRSFVTTNYVNDSMMILNGGPSFITLAEKVTRPHDVLLHLPDAWKHSMTGLAAAPDGKPHHYHAADFDTLVDSPIVAGILAINEFEVDGSKHFVVAVGDTGQWDGGRAARDLEKVVRENRRMWGFLPFKKYVFLFSLKGGGGGLEHANSALMMSNAAVTRGDKPNLTWLNFVSHEYFHAFNVKRLRPVELGPFDYENPPKTTGLWVSEGLTNYYGPLIVSRSGLGSPKDYLAQMSSHIDKLQKSPGRLVQTLDKSSYDVWTTGGSGIGGGVKTISYYTKGPVVGFLLEAKIQRATAGKKSMDDFMKLAYQRHGGEKGFTPDQLRQTAEEIAGIDLKEPFHKWLATTEELDYSEALDWFGLRFAQAEGQPTPSWRLEVKPDATAQQTARLEAWLGRRDK